MKGTHKYKSLSGRKDNLKYFGTLNSVAMKKNY